MEKSEGVLGKAISNFSSEEVRALLRNDFGSFTERCFLQLHDDNPIQPNWHQELIASKLEACFRGECRRLIINIPPRHLKSLALRYFKWVVASGLERY